MIVRRCRDRAVLRALLNADSGENAYALGDLDPAQWNQSVFWGASEISHPSLSQDLQGIALLFNGFSIPILTMHGTPAAGRAILSEITLPVEVFCSLPERFAPVVEDYFEMSNVHALWRMLVTPSEFRPNPESPVAVKRLWGEDAGRMNEFYKNAVEPGEELLFFSPEQVINGVFYSIEEDGKLVAAAGTHVLSMQENIAAVGSVFTAKRKRGHGFATAVTSRVTQALFEMGITRVALNVRQDNAPAIHIYKKLGYQIHCPMLEGPAFLKSSAAR